MKFDDYENRYEKMKWNMKLRKFLKSRQNSKRFEIPIGTAQFVIFLFLLFHFFSMQFLFPKHFQAFYFTHIQFVLELINSVQLLNSLHIQSVCSSKPLDCIAALKLNACSITLLSLSSLLWRPTQLYLKGRGTGKEKLRHSYSSLQLKYTFKTRTKHYSSLQLTYTFKTRTKHYSSLQLTYTFKTRTKHYSSLQLTYTFKTRTKHKKLRRLALCAFIHWTIVPTI